MNNVDILTRHISPDVPLVLKNEDGSEDTIMLRPLNMAEQSMAFEISKGFKEGVDIKDIDTKYFNLIFDLFKSVLIRSFDEDLEDSVAENFVTSNFEAFSKVLEKLIPSTKSKTHADLINNRRSAK